MYQGNFPSDCLTVAGQDRKQSILQGVMASREVVPWATYEVVPLDVRLVTTTGTRGWQRDEIQTQMPA